MPRAKPDETALATLLNTFFLKDDLQSLLEDANLPVSGTKDELIDRLLEEADYSPEELLNYHYKDDLKEFCEDLDLPVSGRKDELVDRLIEFLLGIEIEEAEEEEEPAPAPRPRRTVVRPERVEVPATGLIGTEEGFLGLNQSIEGWTPLKRHRTEEGYQMDLRQYLQYECGYQCRLEGVEMADIVVEDKFPVELKKNPTQAEYDRLLGQLTRMHRAKNFAVGVICDVRRLEIFLDFKQQIDRIFGDGSVAIVQK
ncbi:MAG: SAP domain-containing protein [Thermoplasmata archaeon]